MGRPVRAGDRGAGTRIAPQQGGSRHATGASLCSIPQAPENRIAAPKPGCLGLQEGRSRARPSRRPSIPVQCREACRVSVDLRSVPRAARTRAHTRRHFARGHERGSHEHAPFAVAGESATGLSATGAWSRAAAGDACQRRPCNAGSKQEEGVQAGRQRGVATNQRSLSRARASSSASSRNSAASSTNATLA